MRRLLVIICTFLFFACQNEENGKKKVIAKNDGKSDSGSFDSITTNEIVGPADFIEYWKKFRQAVLNSDTNKISSLTDFPIQTRGSLDSDPIIEYSKRQFPRLFNFFLKQWAGDENSSSEFDIIKSTEVPKDKVTHDQVRVGDMVFFLTDKKWKLTFLYLDYETIDSIKLTK